MKKLFKPFIVLILGISIGYYICYSKSIANLFNTSYKAFQVGVYTSYDAALTYSTKYENSVVIKDDELYRVYIAVLKDKNNIANMSNYLDSQGIEYYLKDIKINDLNTKREIKEYETLMNNDNVLVFLEINKMIIETYRESL